MHTPVLLEEAIKALEVERGGLYIDATAGEGGYIAEILKAGGKVLGIDADKTQIERLSKRHPELVSGPGTNKQDLTLVVGNFADIEKIAKKNGFFPVDGVIFDLGLSMKQIRESEKGFSYMNDDEPLDMRLNTEQDIRAGDIVNSFTEQELYEIFSKLSEEINSGSISKAIVRARKVVKFKTVGDLKKIIDEVIGQKDQRVYSRIFQALRMEVNSEINNLKEGLKGAYMLLKKGGRIAVITFHSVEDRVVKKFGAKRVVKGDRSINFERSATLRVLIKS